MQDKNALFIMRPKRSKNMPFGAVASISTAIKLNEILTACKSMRSL